KDELFVDGTGLNQKALDHILFALTIDIHRGNRFRRVKFLNMHNTIRFIAIGYIIVRYLVGSIAHERDDLVFAIKFSEILAALIAVESPGIVIVPQIEFA